MFGIKVNTQLLLLKMCYFLIFACLAPMAGFLPTIARQLGYSMTTYGAAMMFMSVISMVVVPLSGVIVDKFRIKKRLFLVSIFGIGVVSILFLFVPKAPLDLAKIELKCDAQTTTMTVENENNNLQTTSNVTYYATANHTRGDELITCKLNCQYAEFCSAGFDINNLHTQSDLSYVWMRTTNESQNKFNQIDLALIPKDLEHTEQVI
ncbi:unnamed protein product [Macrosiphum euphorbiae]|uniref:Major facilitator superfamily associated domain-containing protein n=1 Tax=Macrosiphum euphorbiae TaxID=13131 RepID=A0AAV0XVE6_9HEMI|nr:unnamed protein product [Macrosiphum euphorbiae]